MASLIYESFLETKKAVNTYQTYPKQSGIYAIFLTAKSSLGSFGQEGQLIYIGIAKDSLAARDFDQHFKSGKTGQYDQWLET